MSGLGEIGGLPGFNTAGEKVQQFDIDQYVTDMVVAPSVDAAYMGTASPVMAGTVASIVMKSFTPDYPRNLKYTMTGVAGGVGGTFTANGFDQFGAAIVEKAGFATANAGGTVQGTAIFGSVSSITVIGTGLGAGGTAVGTCSVGFGTAAGVTGNWFGLPVKIQSTADVRGITWINNGTATALNKGTALGTLVSTGSGTTPPHAYQGTSGVAITDQSIVTIKPTFDNSGKGIMTNL